MNSKISPQLVAAQHLEQSLSAISALVEGVDDELARVRHDVDSWSLTEILGHLLDEEREDFRARIKLVLEDPDAEWPAIDPEGWVEERGHRRKSAQELLRFFQEERQRSLEWLRALSDSDWHRGKEDPRGTLRAGDLLLAWVAHDLAHLAQIARWHRARGAAALEPFRDDYAY